jgi:hypothetical protein
MAGCHSELSEESTSQYFPSFFFCPKGHASFRAQRGICLFVRNAWDHCALNFLDQSRIHSGVGICLQYHHD